MRNLKKFLALVLAILMVSACAVSVSAFADDAAIKEAGYEEAVAALASVGIITGRNDGTDNYYPNDVLTREEFVVVMSKIVAGEDFASFDWSNKTTCMATDVVDQWSFGYIDFAISKGFMQGDGSGAFNPKGVLTVAEAITAAVKAVPQLAYEVKMQEFLLGAPAYWAQYYLAIAEEVGLTENVPTFDPTAQITRAQMAQVGYNLINFLDIFQPEEPEVDENLVTVEGIVVGVTSDLVEVDTLKDDEQGKDIIVPFNRVAVQSKVGDTDLAKAVNCAIKVVYNKKTNALISVEIENLVYTYTYLDGKVSVKDGYITIDGTKYVIGADISSGTASGGIGAGTTDAEDGVAVYGLTSENKLPTYWKAVAYNNDGKDGLDLVIVQTYDIATLDEGKEFDIDDDNKDVAAIVVKDFDTGATWSNNNDTKKAYYVLTGVEVALDGKTPAVVGYSLVDGEYVVDVLDVAVAAKGTLTSISADQKITVDGAAVENHAQAKKLSIATDVWMLNQPIDYLTLEGKFIVTYEAPTNIEGIVDSVVIDENKNAVVTLIMDDFTFETITVVGATNGAKLNDAIDAFVKLDDDDKIKSWIYLAAKADGAQTVELAEGTAAKFVGTEKGYYYAGVGVNVIDLDTIFKVAGSNTTFSSKIEAKNGYIYHNGTAKWNDKLEAVISKVVADEDDIEAYSYNNVQYKVEENLPVADTLTVNLFDDSWKSLSSADMGKDVVYAVVLSTKTEKPVEKVTALEGTLVYVNDVEAVDYTLDTVSYKVINLFTGEEIVVVLEDANDDIPTLEAENFYTVEDGKLVEKVDSKWILDEEAVALQSVYTGLEGKITGNYMWLEDGVVKTDDATYGIEIVIYKVEGGKIVVDDDGEAETIKVADYLLKGKTASFASFFDYEGYSVKGQMILLAEEK